MKLISEHGAAALRPQFEGGRWRAPLVSKRKAAVIRKQALLNGTVGSFDASKGALHVLVAWAVHLLIGLRLRRAQAAGCRSGTSSAATTRCGPPGCTSATAPERPGACFGDTVGVIEIAVLHLVDSASAFVVGGSCRVQKIDKALSEMDERVRKYRQEMQALKPVPGIVTLVKRYAKRIAALTVAVLDAGVADLVAFVCRLCSFNRLSSKK